MSTLLLDTAGLAGGGLLGLLSIWYSLRTDRMLKSILYILKRKNRAAIVQPVCVQLWPITCSITFDYQQKR